MQTIIWHVILCFINDAILYIHFENSLLFLERRVLRYICADVCGPSSLTLLFNLSRFICPFLYYSIFKLIPIFFIINFQFLFFVIFVNILILHSFSEEWTWKHRCWDWRGRVDWGKIVRSFNFARFCRINSKVEAPIHIPINTAYELLGPLLILDMNSLVNFC